jgi:hypothetical protein
MSTMTTWKALELPAFLVIALYDWHICSVIHRGHHLTELHSAFMLPLIKMTHSSHCFIKHFCILSFVTFLVVLGFELRASYLLDRHSTT